MSSTANARRTSGGTSGDATRRGFNRDRFETGLFRVLRPVVVVLLLLVALLPFYYMILLSFRSLDSLLQNPGALWISIDEVDLGTYRDVLAPVAAGGQGFVAFLRNSLLVALGTVAMTLLVTIPGSYAVSRLQFFGRRQVSGLFLAVYFFPSVLLAVPLFVLFTQLGLRGSLVGLVLVYVSQVAAVSIYTLRNYFATVPVALEEAASIDGASRLQILRRISLPLAMPAVVSNGLFIFMIAWNEFLFALLLLVERRDAWTVSLGLSQLSGSIEVPTTVLMAGSVILTLPIVVLFFAAERLLTGGLTAGAEKG
ncbi:carbohydrate ABC transporter permease [uncultured Arthrobacter sp.]|uniref:carbohydrate ABC transporter permease n=1 Tax=uncultured Arthrobacter sp. TaxID=114050 RepID=UPI0026187D51|nr:carbohydrate ABC transporter permease [uncultured Arthrobacter sp.]